MPCEDVQIVDVWAESSLGINWILMLQLICADPYLPLHRSVGFYACLAM